MSDPIATWIEGLARPNVRAMRPYRAARHDHAQGILLDANESPYPTMLNDPPIALNRYPDPLQAALRMRLAELNGMRTENVFVGAGSDEAIDLLIRVFCEPRLDAVAVAEPTYGMYRVAAALNDVAVHGLPLNEAFDIDAGFADRALRLGARLLFLCSPNNPTGNRLAAAAVLDLCRAWDRLVVVDEAYVEFSARPSMARCIAAHPNLVVLRTMSKAWGAAGIRLGYLIANAAVVSLLLKVKSPYNVGSLAAGAALSLLAHPERLHRVTTGSVSERERVAARLTGMRSVRRVFPSDANFLLVRVDNARCTMAVLAEQGIIVRDRSSEPRLEECIRISIGTPEENDRLMACIEGIA